MTFKVIRGQGQGEEMTSVPYWDIFSRRELLWITDGVFLWPDALPGSQLTVHSTERNLKHFTATTTSTTTTTTTTTTATILRLSEFCPGLPES